MTLSMIIFVTLFAAALGAIFGSFLNVVALRFNTGKSLSGRSECFSCGHVLSWKDLFPILSFTLQRGRCRYCSSRISWDNIYAEIVGAVFFTAIILRGIQDVVFFSSEYWIATGLLLVVASFLIVIFLYDVRHKIIPDELSLTFGILGLIGLFMFGFNDMGVYVYQGFNQISYMQVLAGIIVPLPFALLWLVSKGKWIGLGDPKLMVGMGLFFGISQGFSAVFLSFWIATLYLIIALIIRLISKYKLFGFSKHTIMSTEIPFAPFLIFGTLATFVVNFSIFSLI